MFVKQIFLLIFYSFEYIVPISTHFSQFIKPSKVFRPFPTRFIIIYEIFTDYILNLDQIFTFHLIFTHSRPFSIRFSPFSNVLIQILPITVTLLNFRPFLTYSTQFLLLQSIFHSFQASTLLTLFWSRFLLLFHFPPISDHV